MPEDAPDRIDLDPRLLPPKVLGELKQARQSAVDVIARLDLLELELKNYIRDDKGDM